MRKVVIGLIGFGTIGTGVAKILKERSRDLIRKTGISLELKKIADLDITTERGVEVSPDILTTLADDIFSDPEIDIVIELIGGYEPARTFIRKAILAGKHVVTANKALLSKYGGELLRLAADNNVELYFEGSVGGGIPLIRALREGLLANRIEEIYGIINGTSNYILTKMTDEGRDFAEVLAEAQEKGYAERDPSLDIEGIDASHKITILATIAFGVEVHLEDIYCEGISDISSQDILYAQELGYAVKLLAIAKQENNEIEVRVHPTMIPQDHLLASVKNEFNAVYVTGDAVGSMMFYGKGAGQMPTASAIIGDIIDIARLEVVNKKSGRAIQHALPFGAETKKIKSMEDIITRYYLRVMAVDEPGVMARVAKILGDNNISIATVVQKERRSVGDVVPIVMLTHEALERDINRALKEIDKLEVIKGKSVLIRMEGE